MTKPTIEQLAKEAAAWDATKDGSAPWPGAGEWVDAPEAVPMARPYTRLEVLRARFKSLLIRIALLGPVAMIVVERVAHLFGICLGTH